jgi:hypothetical protein
LREGAVWTGATVGAISHQKIQVKFKRLVTGVIVVDAFL